MKRKILCISVVEKDDGLYARFETNPFFEDGDSFRRSLTGVQTLKTYDPDELVKDSDFYNVTVMWVGVVIAVMADNIDKKTSRNNILYPCVYENRYVLRMDRTKKEDFKNKKFCCDLKLPDKEKITDEIQTDEYLSKLGRIICKYLPLGPFDNI